MGNIFNSCNEKGFSLIEVLLYSSLLVIILGIVYSFLGQIFLFWKDGSGMIDYQQNARIAMQLLERDLRNAKPYSSDIYILIRSDGKEIRFKIPNGKGNLNEIKYYKNGNILLRQINNEASNNVAYNVQNVKFSFYKDPDTALLERSLVTIDLEVGNKKYVYKLSSNIFIRTW